MILIYCPSWGKEAMAKSCSFSTKSHVKFEYPIEKEEKYAMKILLKHEI
jgi:hypothetical protein